MKAIKYITKYYSYLFFAIMATTLFSFSWINFENLNNKKASKVRVKIGAYYFDGWSGLTYGHLTRSLMDSFPERESTWGWITSKQNIMQEQINTAANAGVSFFSFCWYYPNASKNQFEKDPLNRALNFYLKVPNKKNVQFCLLVTNHNGFLIGPSDWNKVSQEWLKLFQDSSYLKVNGKPLLIFFTVTTLIEQFGSTQAVKIALDSLKDSASKNGFSGVTFAACVGQDQSMYAKAKECGFDILTGYNYHYAGFQKNDKIVPIDSLITGSRRMWDRFQQTDLPYIPCVTLNWDPRPWAVQNKSYANSPRYTGYSSGSVYKSIRSARTWLELHPDQTPKEKIILLYAWNEYGEGAWLTPSRNQKDRLLDGVKKAIK